MNSRRSFSGAWSRFDSSAQRSWWGGVARDPVLNDSPPSKSHNFCVFFFFAFLVWLCLPEWLWLCRISEPWTPVDWCEPPAWTACCDADLRCQTGVCVLQCSTQLAVYFCESATVETNWCISICVSRLEVFTNAQSQRERKQWAEPAELCADCSH